MNSDFPQNENAKLEAKLTALLLGELHADEIAALSKAMEMDPELVALYERLKVTIELVREMKPAVEEPAPLKLSAEKREKLLASFKTVTPAAFAKPRRVSDWLVPMAACAAIVTILGALLLPSLSRAKYKSERAYASRRDSGVAVTPQEQGPAAPIAAPAPLMTLAPALKLQNDFSVAPAAAPSVQTTSTTIVLPAQQSGDVVAASGKEDGFNLNVAPWVYAHSTDISEALKRLGGEQTNVVALNSWGPRDARQAAEFGRFKPDVVASQTVTITNGIVGTQTFAARTHDGTIENADQHELSLNTDPRLAKLEIEAVSKLGVVSNSGQVALSTDSLEAGGGGAGQTNYFFAQSAADRAPTLGDVPAVERLYKSESSVAQNGDFKTALTKDDLNGLRYLMTNSAVTSQPIAEGTSIWAANSAKPGAGANIHGSSGFIYQGVVDEAATNPAWVGQLENAPATNSSAFVGRYAYVDKPSANDGLLTGGLRTSAPVGGAVPGEGQKEEIVLPGMALSDESGRQVARGGGGGSGGGFGGAGGRANQNSILTTRSQRASGGKQVELAAAANARATSSTDQSRLETATIKVDPTALYAGLQNVSTISFGKAATNAPSVASVPPADSNGAKGLRYVTGLAPGIQTQIAVTNFLNAVGVNMDPAEGKSVVFDDRQGTLTVRGTEEDLELIQQAMDTLSVAPPQVAVKTKFAEVNSNDTGRLGFEWYLRKLQKTNGAVAVSAGSMPEAEVKAIENQRGAQASNQIVDRAKPARAGNVQTSQIIQDGKLLYQLGKTDEAETKFEEALDADPNNQSALYYLSLAKQVRDRQVMDGRNVTSMNRMAQVEKGWSDVGARQRTNTIDTGAAQQKTSEKLDNIIFDKVSFADLTLDEVVRLLTQQTLRRDIDQEGIQFVLNRSATDKNLRAVTVSLAPGLTNASLKDLLEAVVKGADRPISYKILDQKVEFSFQNSTNSPVATRNSKIDVAAPKPAVPPPTPQSEILTRENAFSTFSLNVSDVSFKLAAATLTQGQMPEPGSIRSEEFINAFDYRDPEAAPGVPIAFASERARYPFAHNRELLRFSLKTAAAGRQAGRPLNIVLLLDNSGSMERADRVGIIREALRVLAGQLQAGDTFSIVTFARTAQLRVDGIPGNQAAAAADEISKLTPEGGTNLGEALDLAYETARHHYLAHGDNRVVLLTDGAANLGDVNADTLKQKVEAQRQQGIALDCFGIGWEGYNDDLLEVLTRNGDGRYGFINTPAEANTEFVAQIAGALHVAAADVKVQVEFNTNRVTSYRQIGYAKHQLTKEQFRDNTVDAAEIAAQEAGNALYTIEINPEGSGSIATVRVRYKVPGTTEYREQAWDVPYTDGAVAMDQASPAMRLAATACAFSEWLATSPFAVEVSTDELLRYMNGVPQFYGADGRPAKLEWMIRQAKSISGK